MRLRLHIPLRAQAISLLFTLLIIPACDSEGEGRRDREDLADASVEPDEGPGEAAGVDLDAEVEDAGAGAEVLDMDRDVVDELVMVPDPPATLVVGASSCLIDLDCEASRHCFLGTCSVECDEITLCGNGESCSARGRCLASQDKSADGAPEGAVDEVLHALRFSALPARVQVVPSGVGFIEVTATLNGEAPADGMNYRVETLDLESETRVLRARSEGDTVTFSIPTGLASPDLEMATFVDANVVSSVGSFRLQLIPQPPVSGEYTGEVRMDTFGHMGVPIEMMLVVEPPEASLEDSTAAWLLLPVRDDVIFSPREPQILPDDAPDAARWQAQELVFDDFTERWVARFNNEFRLASDSLLGARPAGQIGRTIRVELTPFEGKRLVGSLTDRWTGLYDQRNRAGVLERGIVTFNGDFEVTRIGAALSSDAFEVAAPSTVTPEALPLPPIDACDNSMLAVDPITLEGIEYSCDVLSLDSLVIADSESIASCAIAVAENALSGESTASMLASFLGGEGGGTGGRSFSEFMEACAAGIDGECRPSDEVSCGRQLLAYAYVSQDDDITSSEQLVESFQTTTRESFLGRQLGAFQTDADKRLEWLRTSDYPAIVTAAVQDLNAQLLDEWVTGVLNVHLEVLSGQFDASGLAVLTRQPTGADAAQRRRELLLQMSQSWRGVMESLVLLAQRWDTLYQDAESRATGHSLVASKTLDLYLTAGLLGNLNRSAGSGFANAAFGSGFGALSREARALALPFEKLIYARDAEIVISTSLDPEASNNTVLRDLATTATEEIESVNASVQTVLAESQARALNETQLRDQLANDIDALRSELVSLCGLPADCALRNYGEDPECEVRTDAAVCGFRINKETDQVPDLAPSEAANVSEAGAAIVAIEEAMVALRIAESERDAHVQRANRAYDDASEFAQVIERWNDQRSQTIAEINILINDNQAAWDDTINELTGLVQEAEDTREERVQRARQRQDEWENVEAGTQITTLGLMLAATGIQIASDTFRDNASDALRMSEIIKEGFPMSAGMSNDLTSSARMTVLMSGFATYKASRTFADLSAGAANVIRANAEAVKARSQRRIRDIQQESEFESARYENVVAGLRDRANVIEQEQRARDQQLDNLIEALVRTMEAELAYERDLVEMRDRQSVVFNLANEVAAYQFRVLQAEQQLTQRFQAYDNLAQRGGLVASRLASLESQRENVNLLLGSPDVVFAWANRLEQAESRLERAKDALMDWLVAMEYFAVRPFMDQRLQILLARNPYQLEDISAEMQRLQRACGGALNEQQTTVSLNGLLGLDSEILNPEDGVVYGPAERLRATLGRGAIPIDTRTRTRADQSVADLLSRDDVWAVTFSLELDRFANLASTCNAKIVSFDVQILGEELGEGRPTVSILYDGTSSLRSCQPGIQEYVDQFGPESTAFGPVTTFRAASRSVSPVAGISEFPSDSGGTANLSLGGLPLASQYTLLIDRRVGENANINWNNLEDVSLRVNYAYQDVFPEGQCE